jgi:AraC family transcriptional activator of pobA
VHAAQHLPTYLLYGETGLVPQADVLHCESIAERSQLHAWEIRPHRHEVLFQILYMDHGRAELLLDGRAHAVDGPAAVTVAPLSAHGFRFSPDVQGTVLTVLDAHLQRLLAGQGGLQQAVLRSAVQPLAAAQAAPLRAAVAHVRDEYATPSPWRSLAIDAALLRLLVQLARMPRGEAAQAQAPGARAVEHVRRYRELVERRFREQPSLADCAAELGITATQLNRVCRHVLGHPALAVLHARLVLEAQRELAYTTMSVKQIAFSLGFGDAGYFTRFFERHAGRTPTAWRAAAAHRGVPRG